MEKFKDFILILQIHAVGTDQEGVLFKQFQHSPFVLHIPNENLAFLPGRLPVRIKGINVPVPVFELNSGFDAFTFPVKVDLREQLLFNDHCIDIVADLHLASLIGIGQNFRDKAFLVLPGKEKPAIACTAENT
jgi:hypothetical protein